MKQVTPLTLSFLLTDIDIDNLLIEINLIKFVNTLSLFKRSFTNCLIIVDSIDKKKDPKHQNVDFIFKYLTNQKIINHLENCKVHFVRWESEFVKINSEISKVYQNTDVNLFNMYKNNVAHMYSFLQCETKYMFHIDIPRKHRVDYIPNNATENFITKSIENLTEDTNVYAYCLMKNKDNYVNNRNLNQILKFDDAQFMSSENILSSDNPLYQIHFDNKPNISLQCTVFDIHKIKITMKNWSYKIYKFQFENQLTCQMRHFSLIAGTFLPNNVFPMKIDFK